MLVRHCTQPVPALQSGFPEIKLQSAFVLQPTQLFVALQAEVVAEPMQSVLLRHCTQPVPTLHCDLPAISEQSPITLQPTQLFVALHTELAADPEQSEFAIHWTQPVPALHRGLPAMEVQSAALPHTPQELAVHFEAVDIVQSLFIKHCTQASDTQKGLPAAHCVLFVH
jgi:hypothetical protein